MIKLFKNLWKCFVKGEKGPGYEEPCEKEKLKNNEEYLAKMKEKYRLEIYNRLNSRGKSILDEYEILNYNHLIFMTVPSFKELDGCGQKTAEHMYGTIQDFINGFDDGMVYLHSDQKNKGDDLDFDTL